MSGQATSDDMVRGTATEPEVADLAGSVKFAKLPATTHLPYKMATSTTGTVDTMTS